MPDQAAPTTAPTATHQLGHIARGGALNLVGAAVSAGAQLGLVVLLANIVDQETAGQYFALTSGFLILLAVASLGTDSGLARFVLRFHEQGRHGDIVTCLRVARRPVVAVGAALSVAAVLLADPVARLMGLPEGEGATAVRALAVLLPFAALNDVSLAATRAFGRMRSTVVVDRVLRPVSQPVGAALVVTAGGGLVALGLSWALPYVAAAGFSAYLLHRLQNRWRLERTTPSREGAHAVRREFWAYTWPRSLARICQIVLQRADIVIVAALLSPADAAIYTAATRFVVLGQFGANAIQQVLQPRLSQILAHDRFDVAEEVVRTSTAWNVAIAWPVYALVGSASTVYLGFFGDGYGGADARVVVVVMAVAMMLAVSAGPVDTLLLMAGRSATSLANTTAALLANLVLCFTLIPTWGIRGAAVAWAGAVVLRNGLAVWQVHRGLGVTAWSRPASEVGAAVLLCLVAPTLLVAPHGLAPTSATAVGGLLAYGTWMWVRRRSTDLDVLLEALRQRGRTRRRDRPVPAGQLRGGTP